MSWLDDVVTGATAAIARVEAFLDHAEASPGSLVFCRGKTLRPGDLRAILALLPVQGAAISEGEGEVGGWLPIETAPRNNRSVLLWFSHGMPNDRIVLARWDAKRDLWNFKNHASWGSSVRGLPTHWQPLPPPPPQSEGGPER